MVLEDYTLKHVWGLRPSTNGGLYKDSDPDQGSPMKGRCGGVFLGESLRETLQRGTKFS